MLLLVVVRFDVKLLESEVEVVVVVVMVIIRW